MESTFSGMDKVS